MAIHDDRKLMPKCSKLRPVPPHELEAMRTTYPGIPSDYLEFLSRVGAGEIGDAEYMIYSGLTTPSDTFDARSAACLDGLLFFGDDFSGYSAGFDARRGWVVVEVDSTNLSRNEVAATFDEFVRGRL
jgi:hypothetical protein